jgi:hypothetical protein
MWNMKCMIIPLIIITGIIIGVTGIIREVLKKNLEAMAGKHSVDSLKKEREKYQEEKACDKR